MVGALDIHNEITKSITKNIDQINEAYKGSFGQEMMEASRNRINWICSKAKGEKILDVGCSQGTATIILGREGKNATGIDICKESIEYALASLETEDESTRSYVEFVYADFMEYTKNNNQKYDCVIMGEVIEHIADPDRFIKRAYECLLEDGIFVVTVPFGINDYHDHKRTYYLTELYSSVSTDFTVVDVAFLGSWIGMVCSKKRGISVDLDASLFTQGEQAFYLHERKLLNKINQLNESNSAYSKQSNQRQLKINEYAENLKTWKAKVDDLNSMYQKENRELIQRKEELKISREELKVSREELKVSKEELKASKEGFKSMEKSYVDLANSRLGKLQLKIWGWRAKKYNS